MANKNNKKNADFLYSEGFLERTWQAELIHADPSRWITAKIASFDDIKKRTPIPLYTPFTFLNFIVETRNYEPIKRNEIAYLKYFIWYLSNYSDFRFNQDLGNNLLEVEYLTKRLDIITADPGSLETPLNELESLKDLQRLYRKYDIYALKHSFISDFGLSLTEDNILKVQLEDLRIHRKFPLAYSRTCKDVIEMLNSDMFISLICENDPFRALYDLLTVNLIKKSATDPTVLFDDLFFKNKEFKELEEDYQNSLGQFAMHQKKGGTKFYGV